MRKLLILCALLLSSMASADVYSSCAEAAKDKQFNIPSSSFFYSANLDRDKDGIACESGGDDTFNPAFQPFYLPSNSNSRATTPTGSAAAVQVN